MVDADIETASPNRLKSSENCPELALITGSLDWSAFQTLPPEHRDYQRWHGLWLMQDGWDRRQHGWYWAHHFSHWPLAANRASRQGLKAAEAAAWRSRGYSWAQIEDALDYERDSLPKSLRDRAKDYGRWIEDKADFLDIQAPMQGLDLRSGADIVERYEQLYASTIDPSIETGGLIFGTGEDRVAETAEGARRWVRHRWRTPRVVELFEREAVPWGLPDPYSASALYTEAERAQVRAAEARIMAEQPHYEVDQPDSPFRSRQRRFAERQRSAASAT